MLTQNGILLGLAATLPAAGLTAFMLTAPPTAEAQACGGGCYAGGLYYACGYCMADPSCGIYHTTVCMNGWWQCGCGS